MMNGIESHVATSFHLHTEMLTIAVVAAGAVERDIRTKDMLSKVKKKRHCFIFWASIADLRVGKSTMGRKINIDEGSIQVMVIGSAISSQFLGDASPLIKRLLQFQVTGKVGGFKHCV